jgi:RND family efflux transporter MFP subunit
MSTPTIPRLAPLSIVFLLFAACTSTADSAPELRAPPVPVTLADIGIASTTGTVVATGTFASRDEIPLAFKIGGVVTRVLVDAGATVQRGQLLAELDLREIDAAVRKAEVAVDKAQRDHARVQRLAADSVATLAQLQDAQSALDAARADQASARVNREYAVIEAPEAGVVQQRLITPGSQVAPGTPALVLGGTRRGRVLRAGVPDRDALRVRAGDSATVQFDAVGARRYRGTVVLIGRAADPRTGTYAVEIRLDDDADALPSGLVGTATIAVRATQLGVAVPVDALLEADGDSATVYVASADAEPVAQAHRVRVRELAGDRATVDGVPPASRLITSGAAYVTPGARLRVVTAMTLDSAAPGASRLTATRGGPQP